MRAKSKCRFGLHIGLRHVCYVKLADHESGWNVVASGHMPFAYDSSQPEQFQERLVAILQTMQKEHGLSRELVHVTLHNRFCTSRVMTGSRSDLSKQYEEICANSQHYLQLGLGEKLIGQSASQIGPDRWYGQVAIIKRGLIESIDTALRSVSLELDSVDASLSSTCRLAGFAGLDEEPLLVIRLGSGGAEIGISYRGQMQLNYHVGASETAAQTAETVGKHLKRLRRFCERYRDVDGRSELRRVLLLAQPEQTRELMREFKRYDFECMYCIDDFNSGRLGPHLNSEGLLWTGVVSALGGLITHYESDVLSSTDLFEKYLAAKPRSMLSVVLQDSWYLLVAAAIFFCVSTYGWVLKTRANLVEIECLELATGVDEQRKQLIVLDEERKLLNEYHRLGALVYQQPIHELIQHIATCLPEDTRVDQIGVDAQGRLLLKGTMMRGDHSYEVLRALRNLPYIKEVALESVGRAGDLGEDAATFEIQCEITAQPEKSSPRLVADPRATGERAW